MTTPTQQDIEAALPDLPKPSVIYADRSHPAYSAKQMIEYARAAEQAQRERDARIAEGQVSQHDGTFRGLRKAIAAAIRGDEA